MVLKIICGQYRTYKYITEIYNVKFTEDTELLIIIFLGQELVGKLH